MQVVFLATSSFSEVVKFRRPRNTLFRGLVNGDVMSRRIHTRRVVYK